MDFDGLVVSKNMHTSTVMPRIHGSVNNRLTSDKIMEITTEHEKIKSKNKDENITNVLIENAVEKANENLIGSKRKLEYIMHEKTKKVMVKIINSETMEVVREIPSEKALNMFAKMLELAGLLADQKR